jgi:predicted nucleic acid-binding protein
METDTCILIAPGLLVYEILNILRLKEEISTEEVNNIISDIYSSLLLVDAEKELLKKAFGYSREYNISFYDSIYITLSEKYDAPLITADKKLFTACTGLRNKPLLVSKIGRISDEQRPLQ